MSKACLYGSACVGVQQRRPHLGGTGWDHQLSGFGRNHTRTREAAQGEGGSHRGAGGVDQDHALHLTRQADRLHGIQVRLLRESAHRTHQRGPPRVRILLSFARGSRVWWVVRAAGVRVHHPATLGRLAGHHRLDAGGARVEGENTESGRCARARAPAQASQAPLDCRSPRTQRSRGHGSPLLPRQAALRCAA